MIPPEPVLTVRGQDAPSAGPHGAAGRPTADGSARRPAVGVYRWAVLLTALPLLYTLSSGMWKASFPISETVSILADAGVLQDTSASSHSLRDPRLASIFNPATRSWYRPFYWMTWYGFWHATHSLEATLRLFRVLEVLTVVLLIGGFLWHLDVDSFPRYAAALLALAVLVGMPGFRENLEIPLPMTLVGMALALGVWAVLEREHRSWHGFAIVAMTAVAVGFKEQGLVLVPVVVGAWWAGAPGIRRHTALATVVLTVAYLAMRFGTAGSWSPFEQSVGLGFAQVPASDAVARFGAFPYGIYLYNASATVANVLFSEPGDGVFRYIRAGLDGRLRPWAIVEVLTSTTSSALLVWWAVRTWRRDRSVGWTRESRLLLALVLALGATGALGFNYARDRLGGMAVVFYALASYDAVAAATGSLREGGVRRFACVVALLVMLSAGWQLRAVVTADYPRLGALRSHREWIATRQHQRLAHDSGAWQMVFAAMESQGLALPPRRVIPETWQRWLGPD